MTDAIDLTTEQRTTLSMLLGQFLPGVAVWAYGSRVKWTARPNSDLDLVAFTTPAQHHQVAEIKDALAESNLPFPVDLHVWDEVPERFREIIRKEYVVVQEAKLPESKTSMPGEWPEVTTFANLIEEGALEIGDGYRAKNEELGGDGLIFLRAGHVTDSHINFTGVERFHAALEARVRSKLSMPGDAVVTTKGNSTGRTTFVTSSMPRFVYSPHLSYWRSKDRNRIEGGFLRYWSKGSEFSEQLSGMKASTDMAPYLSLIDQKRLRISLPPIVEQRAIAHILGQLDDKIELNRRMNETLEAMVRTLFKSWFVDFDPVHAKAEGRDSCLPKHLATLFPDSFEDSELGEIPRGWELRTIEELSEQVAMGPFGSSIKISTFVSEGVPVISGQHLRGTLLDDSEFNFITEEHADQLKRSNVQRGDVIFTHAGSIGQVAYIPETSRHERYIISQRQFYMRCNPTKVSPLFIVSYFKTPGGQHRLLANTSSTGVPSISQPVSYLRHLQIVLPPHDLLNIFDSAARSIYRTVAHNENQSRALTSLRDTLLPKLISGELRVQDMNRFEKGMQHGHN
ncbi:MAG: restriction endonuclease subunit S [Nitrospirota bacterium]